MVDEKIKDYLHVMAKTGLYPNKGNLKFLTDTLFEDIDLKNKSILDIGGGYGLFSYYAACSGAKEVICIEPELEGCATGVNEKFHNIKSMLNVNNIYLKKSTFQDFNYGGKSFDVILLYNSINHLDEMACINLLYDKKYYSIYNNIFQKIVSLSHLGTKLIICDCSSNNLFAQLGIRNPFAPTIEWKKHQTPETWTSLLYQFGFINPRISWSSFNTLRSTGRFFLGNKIMAYFLISHFCLKVEKA